MCVCRSLLPKVEAAMFEHWVLPFGREVIMASSHHPLVSGFYKLLATCLTLSKKIGYFQVCILYVQSTCMYGNYVSYHRRHVSVIALRT